MNRSLGHIPFFRAAGIPCLVVGALLASGEASAQVNVAATVNRNQASVGEQIVLTITVSSSKMPSVQPPQVPDLNLPGVAVAGPQGPSTSQEISIVNGQTSQKVTLSYSYYLMFQRPGEVEIPALEVIADGQLYRTSPIRIVVTKPGAGQAAEEVPLQVRVNVSRTQVYQGQEVVVEYVMYEQNTASARIANRQVSQEPSFTGFWAETLLDARQTQVPPRQEVINGVPHVVMPILRLALFPTTSGTLTIPPLGLTATVAMPTGMRNFWGDPVYRQKTVVVSSPERTVEVRPLPPNPPAGFGGAVGSFHLTSRVDRTEVNQGDPVTWTVTLEGQGNLKAIGDFIIPSLRDFRAYDPQVSTTFAPSTEHYGGKKEYERVLIPLHSGATEVPPASFVFFDPEVGEYRTISSARHRLTVNPGAATEGAPLALGLTQAQIRQVGSDIRFIQPDAVALEDEARTIWRSRWYWAIQAVPLALVLTALGVRWRHARLGSDPARIRAMGAQGEARKRLKKAHALKKKGDLQGMTNALGHALTELVADHANVSAAGLTSDRIRDILTERKVPAELIEQTLAILGRCDRARYAPSAVTQSDADELYRMSHTAIRHLMRHLTT